MAKRAKHKPTYQNGVMKILDERLIEEAASQGSSMEEIARLCDCSTDTLERKYRDIIQRGRGDLKLRLRRAQIKAALEGNVTMLIFLGKVYLGQRDDEDTNQQITAIKIGIHPSRINDDIAA